MITLTHIFDGIIDVEPDTSIHPTAKDMIKELRREVDYITTQMDLPPGTTVTKTRIPMADSNIALWRVEVKFTDTVQFDHFIAHGLDS